MTLCIDFGRKEISMEDFVVSDEKMYKYGPYRYITKHGIGPGTLPKDVTLVKYEDLDNYYTAIWTDRFLTNKELEEYDIYPENIQNVEDISKSKTTVFESLTEDDIEKLSKLTLTEEELSHVLSLFELINDEDKNTAFELIYAIFSGKKLVPETESIKEKINNVRTKASESYTQKLLGNR